MTIQNDLHLHDEDIRSIIEEFRSIRIKSAIDSWLSHFDTKDPSQRHEYLSYIAEFDRLKIIDIPDEGLIGHFMDTNHIIIVHNIFNHKAWKPEESSKRCWLYLNFMGYVGFLLQNFIEQRLRERIAKDEQK